MIEEHMFSINQPHLSRRRFLKRGVAGASVLTALPSLLFSESVPSGAKPLPPVPLILATDLFRPHNDPDDHFDLACVYALAQRGSVDLRGVLCDFPPASHAGDPDVAAVAMLNHLTGLAAPLVTGMPQRPVSRRDKIESATARDLGGVTWLIETLRASPTPVAITVVGSCRDVALAARRAPEVFARQCRAIYLNAGTGTPEPQPGDSLEYNVALDPGSSASMFDVPCPLYWLPCFERLRPGQADLGEVSTHGTLYRFPMAEVLPHLAVPMQRFFLSMLEQEPGTRWLQSLRGPVDPAKLASWGAKTRNMWCTAGFFHLAALAVATDGSWEPIDSSATEPAYRFAPIEVTCDDQGRTQWHAGSSKPPRYKFEVTDRARYAGAMTRALRDLMKPLGRG